MFFLYLKARARPKRRNMPLTMQFEEETTSIGDGYWGLCPVCHKTDGYVDVVKHSHAAHFFICEEHKTRWCIGANLFSDWMFEDAKDREHHLDERVSPGMRTLNPTTHPAPMRSKNNSNPNAGPQSRLFVRRRPAVAPCDQAARLIAAWQPRSRVRRLNTEHPKDMVEEHLPR